MNKAGADADLELCYRAVKGLSRARSYSVKTLKQGSDLVCEMKQHGLRDFHTLIHPLLVKHGLSKTDADTSARNMSRWLNTVSQPADVSGCYMKELMTTQFGSKANYSSAYGEETQSLTYRRQRAKVKCEAVLRVTNKEKIDGFLDFGCGDGLLAKAVKDHHIIDKKMSYVIDYNDFSAKGFFTFVKGGLSSASFIPRRTLDLIIFNNVLHHLVDPGVVINVCAALLKDTGKIVVFEHDVESYTDALELDFKHWFYATVLRKIAIPVGPTKYRDKGSWAQLFDDLGFHRYNIISGGPLGAGNVCMSFTVKKSFEVPSLMGIKDGPVARHRLELLRTIKRLAGELCKGKKNIDSGDYDVVVAEIEKCLLVFKPQALIASTSGSSCAMLKATHDVFFKYFPDWGLPYFCVQKNDYPQFNSVIRCVVDMPIVSKYGAEVEDVAQFDESQVVSSDSDAKEEDFDLKPGEAFFGGSGYVKPKYYRVGEIAKTDKRNKKLAEKEMRDFAQDTGEKK
jgi:SAM-dependent methyltransferase